MRKVPSVAVLALVLGAPPVFAQARGATQGQQRPTQPTTARPAQPAPAPAAPQAAAPVPPPQPPAPFPEGAKIGLVNLQAIAQQSAEGKAAAAKIQALATKKQADLAAKQKALTDSQTKLAQGGALLSDAARDQLQKDIDRMTVENQRAEQDAQAELNELQMDLQNDFQRKLIPVLDQLRKDKGLHVLLSAQDAGAIAIEPGIDLTAEAVKRFDAATQAAAPAAAPAAVPAAAPPAARPAAPAPAGGAPAPAVPRPQ